MTVKQFMTISGQKICQVAKEMGVNRSTLSLKINGWEKLTEVETERMAKILGLTEEEIKQNRIRKGRVA